ncbi:hypothetical protein CPB86DRAFT_815465 [Serendipita vermifera]|nr:hypothetical protein CPB86DRAFT_815465 [Serendipita vermifera]
MVALLGIAIALDHSNQPTFSDLMRELSHEQSEALHEVARRAPATPAGPSFLNPPPQFGHLAGSSAAGQAYARAPMPQMQRSSSLAGVPSTPQISSTQPLTGMISESPTETEFDMFPCDYCTASFSRRHDLERHRRGHSGETPYSCEGCGAGFTRSDGRGRHWKLNPLCEQRHFERGGRGKKRSGGSGGPNRSRGGSTQSSSGQSMATP